MRAGRLVVCLDADPEPAPEDPPGWIQRVDGLQVRLWQLSDPWAEGLEDPPWLRPGRAPISTLVADLLVVEGTLPDPPRAQAATVRGTARWDLRVRAPGERRLDGRFPTLGESDVVAGAHWLAQHMGTPGGALPPLAQWLLADTLVTFAEDELGRAESEISSILDRIANDGAASPEARREPCQRHALSLSLRALQLERIGAFLQVRERQRVQAVLCLRGEDGIDTAGGAFGSPDPRDFETRVRHALALCDRGMDVFDRLVSLPS